MRAIPCQQRARSPTQAICRLAHQGRQRSPRQPKFKLRHYQDGRQPHRQTLRNKRAEATPRPIFGKFPKVERAPFRNEIHFSRWLLGQALKDPQPRHPLVGVCLR